MPFSVLPCNDSTQGRIFCPKTSLKSRRGEDQQGGSRLNFKTDPRRNVLIANPGACSESISLHKSCQDAIYLDRTFNCGQFLQSMDRINRVGMPPGTFASYYIPVVRCGIEQLLDRRLAARQQTLYMLLDDDMPVLGHDEEWSLLEREDDLEVVFGELIQELQKRADENAKRATRTTRRSR